MSNKEPDILIIGDCAVDQFMDVDDSSVVHDPDTKEEKLCFLHGSKVPVEKFKSTLAGNSCHVGVACARLGMSAQIYTELGKDDNGNSFVTRFKSEGIDTKYCKLNEDTATNVHAIIWHAGDRTIFSYHEPRTYSLPFETLEKPKWIYYTSLAHGFETFQEDLVSYVKENNDVTLAFNPGSIQLKGGLDALRNVLEVTSILFVNKEEAHNLAQLDNDDDIERLELHKKLSELGVVMSVITDGDKGATVYDGENFVEKEALKDVELVDKTGAGDTYAATFLAALHNGKSLDEALDWANVNSANVLSVIGSIDNMLSKDDLLAKL